jgi:crotonobetainyl-CoA:carnitine CoA-transferase CaiB-like acyl-CoA transferase
VPGALAGLRIVELAHIMAGPVAGLMLADMGAEIVKVEKLPGGDDTRRMVPPRVGAESAAYLMMNRNKRGIALDLKTPGGKAALRRLIERADVLIENYRAGTLEKLGFGYAQVRAWAPRLVYCSLSGFGRTGPYAARGGFDLVAQGMSGLMSVTGEGPGRAPVKVGAPVTDITSGILAAMGILGALQARARTGQGQLVETSLFEAGIVQTYWQSAIALATGTSPGPLGSAHPLNAPYQAFETADGWINVGASNQATWLKLVAALEAPALDDDPRFASNAARMANLPALVEILAPLFKGRTTSAWLDIFDAVNMPAGPVLSIGEMLADPQTLARAMVVETDHATLGPVKTLGAPVKFSDTPSAITRAAPVLGQHTNDVLVELGYCNAEIEDLRASGAVG